MRYSSALVLSTLAVGQAAAANINRHSNFHARRHAMEERNANYENVDWKKVSYDLSGVDWASVFGKTSTTSTPAPTPTSSKKEEVKAQAKATTTPAYTPATATQAAQASATSAHSIGNVLGLSTLVEGVDSFFSSIGAGCKANTPQDHTANGKMWLGDDSQWKATFINDGSDDVKLLCWTEPNAYISNGQPEIVISLPAGSQQTVSFANLTNGVSGACAPAYKHTKMSHAGQLSQAWMEFTFVEQFGTFDMSYEVNTKGDAYTAKGSKCTANKEQCAFHCVQSGVDYCGATADEYKLVNCGAAVGGGSGFAPSDGGASGGCSMGHSSEHIMVTFN